MASRVSAAPVVVEQGLTRYLQQIRQYPMLSSEDEFMLAKRFQEYDDSAAAQTLVTSHLRLVAKVAMSYRGYGLPIGDVIAEGNIGLMHAVRKFDPDKGFRLATYAMWWIKATIQEFVLRSWSLVKMGTTANQKKLFFGLRKAKAEIAAFEEGDLRPENVALISTRLGVRADEVVEMNRRMAGDGRLNASVQSDGEHAAEWQDRLVDGGASPEQALLDNEQDDSRRAALTRALDTLNPRERQVFAARRLQDEPQTLDTLATHFGVSRERIRQIEMRAFAKVQQAVLQRTQASQVAAPRSARSRSVQPALAVA